MELPVVFQYQRALDEFRRKGEASPLLKRMSELISLLDLTTTLSSALSSQEILDAALLIVMGELRVTRGALFVRQGEIFERRAMRGVPAGGALSLRFEVGEEELLLPGPSVAPEIAASGLEVVCAIRKAERVIALLALGGRADSRVFGSADVGFLRSVAACAATPIENGLIYDELRRVNQRLSVKVFQLDTLFEVSRELGTTFDEEGIQNVVISTVMGHLLVSRCALYLAEPGGSLVLKQGRGLRADAGLQRLPAEVVAPAREFLRAPVDVDALPEGALRQQLLAARMAMLVPFVGQTRVEGFLAVGRRASGDDFSDEDRDFAQTLVRQALAALESVQAQHARLDRQRRDREMQIAREIQQSLFPRSWPELPSLQLAALSRPCYEVGGDLYDFIPLAGTRFALVMADVSGKGAPASILMASVHAFLRAAAGTLPPPALMERLNQFLFESTQANKYVTLFYAELSPRRRRLTYVSAGHVPPFLLRTSGERVRLTEGGPVLGLLENIRFEVGEIALDPGDLLALVTDGVTEAQTPDEIEFGDVRVFETLRGCASGSAHEVLDGLVGAVQRWSGPQGCADDLTAMILKAL
jgi:phosphoserine phosphatase RsbU/P